MGAVRAFGWICSIAQISLSGRGQAFEQPSVHDNSMPHRIPTMCYDLAAKTDNHYLLRSCVDAILPILDTKWDRRVLQRWYATKFSSSKFPLKNAETCPATMPFV